MDSSEKFLQNAYALCIALMLPSVIGDFLQYTQQGETISFVIMALFGFLFLFLGLFAFQKGLGVGLTLAGISCGIRGSAPYWHKISDVAKFAVALLMLFVVLWTLYRMMSKEEVK